LLGLLPVARTNALRRRNRQQAGDAAAADIVDAGKHHVIALDFHHRRRGWADVFVRDGGLISYGVDLTDLQRRAAGYVDQILKGATPSDLPTQLPTKFDFIVNLKTAKALDLTVPPAILARVDEVIE
jgi:putative ABC transport system substrate-binding protein